MSASKAPTALIPECDAPQTVWTNPTERCELRFFMNQEFKVTLCKFFMESIFKIAFLFYFMPKTWFDEQTDTSVFKCRYIYKLARFGGNVKHVKVKWV